MKTTSTPAFAALRRGRQNLFAATLVIALVAAVGSAAAAATNIEVLVTGKIPRPGQIWVYNFAATPADLPAGSALAGHPDLDPTPPTADQIQKGRQLGAQIAAELVEQIRSLGMPARQAAADTKPQLNDLVFRGYLISIKEGSAKKRFGIGFGEGASELKTAMEAFQVTTNGLRKLGSGEVDAGGTKSPGAAVGAAGFLATKNPAGLIITGGIKAYDEGSGKSTIEGRAKQTAKEIADQLKIRFQDRGWIN